MSIFNGASVVQEAPILEAVMRKFVEVFSFSLSAWESAAQAYEAGGKTALALAHFRKALELDPENQKAARMIQRLERSSNKPKEPVPPGDLSGRPIPRTMGLGRWEEKVSRVRRGIELLLHDPRELRRAIGRRLRRRLRLDYRFGRRGKAAGPYVVTLRLTNRCNLRCRMCFLYGELGDGRPVEARFSGPEDMTLADWKAAIDSVASRKPSVGLTGGEPILNRHCFEIIRHVKNRGLYCGMVTNGTFLRERADEVVASGLDSLWISLDGPEDVHDRIRGVPGAFRRAVEGALAVREAKTRAGSRRPEVGVNFTLVHDNHRYVEDVIATAVRIGAAEIHFDHLFFWTEDMTQAHEGLFGQEIPCAPSGTDGLQGLDPREVHAALEKVRRGTHPLRIRFLPDLSLEETVAYYERPSCLVKSDRCLRPWAGVYIQPNGDVSPCLDYVTGNVKEQPLSEIWNGERFRRFRRLLREHKAFPVCARCCGLFDESI